MAYITWMYVLETPAFHVVKHALLETTSSLWKTFEMLDNCLGAPTRLSIDTARSQGRDSGMLA